MSGRPGDAVSLLRQRWPEEGNKQMAGRFHWQVRFFIPYVGCIQAVNCATPGLVLTRIAMSATVARTHGGYCRSIRRNRAGSQLSTPAVKVQAVAAPIADAHSAPAGTTL